MLSLFAVNEMESICKRRVSLELRASRWVFSHRSRHRRGIVWSTGNTPAGRTILVVPVRTTSPPVIKTCVGLGRVRARMNARVFPST